jgi:Mrp family chromosome partitioning ATPase
MEKIQHKLLVLSGKGGVGKSTVATNLAVALARAGKHVGLLDVDVHGPSIPKLVGLEGQEVVGDGHGLAPVSTKDGVKVMSVGFLLPTADAAVVWRGPRKYGLIKQFLSDVAWGELDYLVIDAPPGTGDEPLAVAELVQPGAAAVLVTTPQDLAIADVRRSLRFCREVFLPVVGIVENMSGLVCPACGERVEIFGSGGGERLAETARVPFLGRIPIDPHIVAGGDSGLPALDSDLQVKTAEAFTTIVEEIFKVGAGTQPLRIL